MYKNIIILITTFFFCHSLCAEILTKGDSIYNKALQSFKNENYKEALLLCNQALHEYENTIGTQNNSYLKALNIQGRLYSKLSQFENAEHSYRKALYLNIKLYGAKNKLLPTLLNNLAYINKQLENFSVAESFYIEAINVNKELYGVNDKNYINSLNNIATLYFTLNEYEKAEHIFLISAHKLKENYGTLNGDYALTINNLGVLYLQTSQYSKAEKFILESLDIRKKLYTENSSNYAQSLANAATFYCTTGQFEKAASLYERALKIKEIIHGENSLTYASTLNNLASTFVRLNQTSKAESLLKRCLEIKCTLLDSTNTDIAVTLHNLAILFVNKKEYSLSEGYFKKAAEIYAAKLGENSVNYATTIAGLARVQKETNNYNTAESLYIQALNIIKGKVGTLCNDYIIHMGNLANLYYCSNKYAKARSLISDHFILRKKFVSQNFLFMSETQRNKFLGVCELDFSLAYPRFCYYDYTHNDSISCLAYDNELFKKGLLLNTSNEIQRSILESGDSALIDKWRALQQTKERIIKLQSQSKDNHTVLAELESKAEQLDKELTKASAAYREANSQFNISWKDVQQKLKQNDVAIEFVSFQDSADVTYYALLLKKDYKYPKLIPICTEREIAQSLDPTDKKRAAYKYSQTNHLYDNLWSKIAPYIDNGANIYYSPSGILHLMNLEAIPVDKGTYLGDKYNMNRLSSTRELVLSDDNTADKTAVLYGGIKYDLSADDMAKESERYSSDEYLLAMRSIEAGADSLYRGGVRELPGTKAEAEAISRMLDSKFNTITTFYADSANEESFKALSGKKYNILHIGTHGFFWPIETASRQELFKSRMYGLDSDETARYNPLADPMQRSGLLFAGASLAISGKADSLAQNVEDGILTAKEIANIDLKEADLVVLSACETGKGEISGEGVFGLQRGFKQAGAKTIIMSLWKVNDVATKDFMLSFYKHLTNGDSKREAFKAAILDTRKGYPEPDCWASFVMMD